MKRGDVIDYLLLGVFINDVFFLDFIIEEDEKLDQLGSKFFLGKKFFERLSFFQIDLKFKGGGLCYQKFLSDEDEFGIEELDNIFLFKDDKDRKVEGKVERVLKFLEYSVELIRIFIKVKEYLLDVFFDKKDLLDLGVRFNESFFNYFLYNEVVDDFQFEKVNFIELEDDSYSGKWGILYSLSGL